MCFFCLFVFDVTEAAPLPVAIVAQQAELYRLSWVCTLAKGRTANIYTDSRYAFRVAHNCGMLWKQSYIQGNKI